MRFPQTTNYYEPPIICFWVELHLERGRASRRKQAQANNILSRAGAVLGVGPAGPEMEKVTGHRRTILRRHDPKPWQVVPAAPGNRAPHHRVRANMFGSRSGPTSFILFRDDEYFGDDQRPGW